MPILKYILSTITIITSSFLLSDFFTEPEVRDVTVVNKTKDAIHFENAYCSVPRSKIDITKVGDEARG